MFNSHRNPLSSPHGCPHQTVSIVRFGCSFFCNKTFNSCFYGSTSLHTHNVDDVFHSFCAVRRKCSFAIITRQNFNAHFYALFQQQFQEWIFAKSVKIKRFNRLLLLVDLDVHILLAFRFRHRQTNNGIWWVSALVLPPNRIASPSKFCPFFGSLVR